MFTRRFIICKDGPARNNVWIIQCTGTFQGFTNEPNLSHYVAIQYYLTGPLNNTWSLIVHRWSLYVYRFNNNLESISPSTCKMWSYKGLAFIYRWPLEEVKPRGWSYVGSSICRLLTMWVARLVKSHYVTVTVLWNLMFTGHNEDWVMQASERRGLNRFV